MSEHDPVIAELKQSMLNLLALFPPQNTNLVQVSERPPGATEIDVTQRHSDATRLAIDAMHKAVLCLGGTIEDIQPPMPPRPPFIGSR
jgi:hypothetical protein